MILHTVLCTMNVISVAVAVRLIICLRHILYIYGVYTSGCAAHRLPNAASSQPRPALKLDTNERHRQNRIPSPALSSSSIFKSSRYLHFHSVRACISSHPLTLFPILSAHADCICDLPCAPCRLSCPSSSHPLPHPLSLSISHLSYLPR